MSLLKYLSLYNLKFRLNKKNKFFNQTENNYFKNYNLDKQNIFSNSLNSFSKKENLKISSEPNDKINILYRNQNKQIK